jgi:hypothetical protein
MLNFGARPNFQQGRTQDLPEREWGGSLCQMHLTSYEKMRIERKENPVRNHQGSK